MLEICKATVLCCCLAYQIEDLELPVDKVDIVSALVLWLAGWLAGWLAQGWPLTMRLAVKCAPLQTRPSERHVLTHLGLATECLVCWCAEKCMSAYFGLMMEPP
jgi:hypothetical protein